ncbi:hypothetical protein [Comamonas sp. lk]|uniref:hypothetical protein n=1 Tax=Comamonas sp. lk TaxID=2201272 RepID=UPI0013CEEBA7|nr:hypothetical protein [Comamonas sp. lk]
MFTEEQINEFLREAEAGLAATELCRRAAVSFEARSWPSLIAAGKEFCGLAMLA